MRLLRNPFNNGRYANQKCFCKSGKKMKRCHGFKYSLTEEEYKEFMEIFDKWFKTPEGDKFFKDELQRSLK